MIDYIFYQTFATWRRFEGISQQNRDGVQKSFQIWPFD